jgi:hypothetical protein
MSAGLFSIEPALRRGAMWRQAGRVVRIQHRLALAGVFIVIAVPAVIALVIGLDVHSHYAAYVSCRYCVSGSAFFDQKPFGLYPPAFGVALRAVPLILGVFVGAPLVANEAESGTHRFAWTQAIGRRRWLIEKLVVIALPAVIGIVLLGWLFQWSYQPFVALDIQSSWSPILFDVSPFALAGWATLAFAAGVLIGTLSKRTVAAMGLTGLLVLALLGATWWTLDDVVFSVGTETSHTAPLYDPDFFGSTWTTASLVTIRAAVSSNAGPLSGALLVSGRLVGPGGKPLSIQEQRYLYERLPPMAPSSQQDLAEVTRQSAATQIRWLDSRGEAFVVRYQPSGSMWLFDFFDGAVLMVLAGLCSVATLRVMRRIV